MYVNTFKASYKNHFTQINKHATPHFTNTKKQPLWISRKLILDILWWASGHGFDPCMRGSWTLCSCSIRRINWLHGPLQPYTSPKSCMYQPITWLRVKIEGGLGFDPWSIGRTPMETFQNAEIGLGQLTAINNSLTQVGNFQNFSVSEKNIKIRPPPRKIWPSLEKV